MAPKTTVMKKPTSVLRAQTVVKDAPGTKKFDGALSKAQHGDVNPQKALSKIQALMKAAHDTISSIPYTAAPAVGVQLHPGALTSFDKDGYPSTRTMIPNFVAPDLSEIRMSTRKGTRKLTEIDANPKASLHFQDQRGRGGWATLKGEMEVRPSSDNASLELVLRPERCEVMSYVEDTMADEEGWKAAAMKRAQGEPWHWV